MMKLLMTTRISQTNLITSFAQLAQSWMKKNKEKTNKPSNEYLTKKTSYSIYLEPLTLNEIVNLILSLTP